MTIYFLSKCGTYGDSPVPQTFTHGSIYLHLKSYFNLFNTNFQCDTSKNVYLCLGTILIEAETGE